MCEASCSPGNALAIYFVLDIEVSRSGIIRVDTIDQGLMDLIQRIQ